MPTYPYFCHACGLRWEVEQKITDPEVTSCPDCLDRGGVERLIASTSFALKGDGWYKDGYSGKKP